MRVAALGLPVGLDPAEAAARHRSDATLVVMPECAAGGYARARRDTTTQAQRVPPGFVLGYFDGVGSAAGTWDDDGAWVSYRKRFLAPGEARFWGAGAQPGIATVGGVRVGMLVCADVLQLAAWESMRSKADVIAVCAAWPHYRGQRPPPGLGWLYAGSSAYRDALIGRAARSLGVPVVLANASGPDTDGLCHIWDGDGRCVAQGPMVDAEVSTRAPDGALHHEGRWRAFAPVYQWGAAGVGLVAGR